MADGIKLVLNISIFPKDGLHSTQSIGKVIEEFPVTEIPRLGRDIEILPQKESLWPSVKVTRVREFRNAKTLRITEVNVWAKLTAQARSSGYFKALEEDGWELDGCYDSPNGLPPSL
ncbi:MAG TPA: hypothetical protein VGP13_02170 [Candidatus Paceibacterota bacterium]|nr:hypothetical protein [Candidatus Paceibacterota bacterium]